MNTSDNYDPELAAMAFDALDPPTRNRKAQTLRNLSDAPRAPFRQVASVTALRKGWAIWLACAPGHVVFTNDPRIATCKKTRCKQCGASMPALPAPKRARPTLDEIAEAIARTRGPRATRKHFDRDLIENGLAETGGGSGSGYSTGCKWGGRPMLVAVR